MKIISFFNSDYNFSAKLARICDIELNELLFEDSPKNIEKIVPGITGTVFNPPGATP